MWEWLQLVSIVLEAGIAFLGVLIAQKKQHSYGWALTLTFGIYVFYDLARLVEAEISSTLLTFSFFVASVSATYLAWRLFQLSGSSTKRAKTTKRSE
jgi:hypothetical protein